VNDRQRFSVGSALNIVFLLALCVTMILPFLNVLSISLSSGTASMVPDIHLFPASFSFEGYTVLFEKLSLWQPISISLFVAGTGTCLNLLLSALAAYALMQPRLPGRRILLVFILVTALAPTEAMLVPLYLLMQQLGLINSLLSLILSGLVSAFSILIIRGYGFLMPNELFEAARMDGAGDWQAFVRLFIPLARPALMVVAIFEFVGNWNMFTEPLLYINSPSLYPLQLALQSLVSNSNATSSGTYLAENAQMAGVVIGVLPLVCLYPFVQRYLFEGLSFGGIK
jgi:putative aldouronate transport system permease protein